MGGKGVEASKVESKERRYIGTGAPGNSCLKGLGVGGAVATDEVTACPSDLMLEQARALPCAN